MLNDFINTFREVSHPGGNTGANIKSISRRCYLREVSFEWKLAQETIHLPLGCLQGGSPDGPCCGRRATTSGPRVASGSPSPEPPGSCSKAVSQLVRQSVRH